MSQSITNCWLLGFPSFLLTCYCLKTIRVWISCREDRIWTCLAVLLLMKKTQMWVVSADMSACWASFPSVLTRVHHTKISYCISHNFFVIWNIIINRETSLKLFVSGQPCTIEFCIKNVLSSFRLCKCVRMKFTFEGTRKTVVKKHKNFVLW